MYKNISYKHHFRENVQSTGKRSHLVQSVQAVHNEFWISFDKYISFWSTFDLVSRILDILTGKLDIKNQSRIEMYAV